jgi:hypothetical protein
MKLLLSTHRYNGLRKTFNIRHCVEQGNFLYQTRLYVCYKKVTHVAFRIFEWPLCNKVLLYTGSGYLIPARVSKLFLQLLLCLTSFMISSAIHLNLVNKLHLFLVRINFLTVLLTHFNVYFPYIGMYSVCNSLQITQLLSR